MMMRVIVSMNDGRADRCSHFRCRKTCTHACIHIYDKRTCQFGRSSTVKFLVGRNSFNSFSLLSIFISISISASLHIFSLSLYLSLTSLLTSNLSLGASALACMFFLPSVPHSFLPSFTPLLLPPTGTSCIPFLLRSCLALDLRSAIAAVAMSLLTAAEIPDLPCLDITSWFESLNVGLKVGLKVWKLV